MNEFSININHLSVNYAKINSSTNKIIKSTAYLNCHLSAVNVTKFFLIFFPHINQKHFK